MQLQYMSMSASYKIEKEHHIQGFTSLASFHGIPPIHHVHVLEMDIT
jgi:hypothetical protein